MVARKKLKIASDYERNCERITHSVECNALKIKRD